MNLPYRVDFGDGNVIEWTYDAQGTKWQKHSSDGLTKDYTAGLEYENETLDAIYHVEGRAVPDDSGEFDQQYCLKDHLGNTRVMFDESGAIIQENHYYPFGMEMNGAWTPANVSDYRYNGKELDREFGLDWYHYGARYYDPAVGRFTGVDPISDQFAWVSTFNYAENEPVRHVDLHGLQKYDLMGHHDPVARQSFESGGASQLKQDQATFDDAFIKTTVAGAAAIGGGVLAAEAGAGVVVSKAASSLFTVETSGTIIATNVVSDGLIQTATNLGNGDDPIENYDIVGALTSALSNPVVANVIDSVFDLSTSEGLQTNSVEEVVVNSAIGGTLGKGSQKLLQSVQNTASEILNGGINLVTGLFTQANKAVATDIIDD